MTADKHAISSEQVSERPPAPERTLVDAAFGFCGVKALMSAVVLKVFDFLATEPLDLETLAGRAGINSRGARDFFDLLVSLGFLTRTGCLYANSEWAGKYLNSAEPTYLGGLLELAETRLYPVWGKLTEALKTGKPQNEAQQVPDYYSNLTQDSNRLQVFLRAMSALSTESARQIARTFPWESYSHFADIGGAEGGLGVELLRSHEHLTGVCFDLPPVQASFQEYAGRFGVADRLRFCGGDFFQDPLPQTDVLIMGHVLLNWDLPQKQILVQKAFEALASGGVLLVYDPMIDEDRKENTFGLVMSLNMLLVTSGGYSYRPSECKQWLENAGFQSVQMERLTGADSAVIGIK